MLKVSHLLNFQPFVIEHTQNLFAAGSSTAQTAKMCFSFIFVCAWCAKNSFFLFFFSFNMIVMCEGNSITSCDNRADKEGEKCVDKKRYQREGGWEIERESERRRKSMAKIVHLFVCETHVCWVNKKKFFLIQMLALPSADRERSLIGWKEIEKLVFFSMMKKKLKWGYLQTFLCFDKKDSHLSEA